MRVSTTYHLLIGEDLSADVLADLAPLPEKGPAGERVLLSSVLLDESRAPGLLVQERDATGWVVVLPVELLLRLSAAVSRLRDRVADDRAVCAEHGYYERGPAEHDRAVDGGVYFCPRCEEARLAGDAADRLRAAGR